MEKQFLQLIFDKDLSINAKGKHVRDGLSAALYAGDNLWVACDERSTVERLSISEDGAFSAHKSFALQDYINLPAGPDSEIDIEGLAMTPGKYLWLVGSHSLVRKKPRKSDSPEKQIRRLARTKKEENRFILARIPIVKNKNSDYDLASETPDPDDPSINLSAATLLPTENGNQLMDLLADDIHFKHFMKIPGKDNGFDIEGLTVSENRIYLGVRGPVLRGWAAIIEIQVEDISTTEFELKPFDDGTLYKKHFLHLDGMGIRDLMLVDEDMYILAGPTMDLDGTIAVYKWKKALEYDRQSIHRKSKLKRLFDVPHGSGETTGLDKAEGMTMLGEQLLIVFDSPTDQRKPDNDSVLADLYHLSKK